MRSWGQSGLMIFPLVKSWIANVLELSINWHLELTGDMASGMSVCGQYYQPLTPGKFHPGDVTEQSMWPCSQEFTFSPQTRNSRSNSRISNSEMAPVKKGIPRRGPQSQTLTESSCLRPVMASLRWAESAWQTGWTGQEVQQPFPPVCSQQARALGWPCYYFSLCSASNSKLLCLETYTSCNLLTA